MKVSWKGRLPWFHTVVYGSPQYQQRNSLWDFFKTIAIDLVEPWAVIGDFNALLHEHERNKRPTRSFGRSMMAFKNTVVMCDLIDVGFQGYLAPL